MPVSTANSSSAQSKSWLWMAVLAMMIIPGIVSLLYLRSAPRKPLDSVAVLPFSHVPGELSIEPLSEQIREELISRLGQITSLKIAPAEAVGDYKLETRPAQTVGHELGVRAIVRGLIERNNDRIRISIELIDSGDNRTLWRRQYQLDGERDAVAIPQEIAGHLADYFSSH